MAILQKRRAGLTGNWPFAKHFSFRGLIMVAVVVLILISAAAIVSTTHSTREQYARMQRLEKQHDTLQTEWGRLLLEESTWSSPARIESLSSDRLKMRIPSVKEVEVIQ